MPTWASGFSALGSATTLSGVVSSDISVVGSATISTNTLLASTVSLLGTATLSAATIISSDLSLLATGTLSASTLSVGGTIRTPLGSQSNPAYTFQNDTNTGVYSPFADQWAITTGAGARLSIKSIGGGTSIAVNNDGANAIGPAWVFSSEASLGLYRSGVSTISLSYGTLNLASQAVRLSMRTLAASALTASAANTNVATNEAVFTIQASGASFVVNSGGTTWIFNSDASAKNT